MFYSRATLVVVDLPKHFFEFNGPQKDELAITAVSPLLLLLLHLLCLHIIFPFEFHSRLQARKRLLELAGTS